MIPVEILIVGGFIVLLLAVSLFSYLGGVMLAVGVVLILLGLILGVPAGIYYHILLYRMRDLLEHGLKRWWIAPQRYHQYLPEKERNALNRWFWIGAVFYGVTIAGCGLVFVGLLISR